MERQSKRLRRNAKREPIRSSNGESVSWLRVCWDSRPGAPKTYDEDFRRRVLATLELPPPKGQAVWDGPAVAKAVGGSVYAVWRVLRKEGICLQRQRSWCVSTDKEFAVKAADIVGLYLSPPENALVISVDEKPSIQALERTTGYVETDSGKIARGFKSTYKRHGTLNLFAALQVATGHVITQMTDTKRREDFLGFMDTIIAETPAGQELHVILDNYCTHKKCDVWLAQHPNVHFHFTPTSASWLNQVAIWFGILSRKALRGASFQNITALHPKTIRRGLQELDLADELPSDRIRKKRWEPENSD